VIEWHSLLDCCVLHCYMLFHLSIACSLVKKCKNVLIFQLNVTSQKWQKLIPSEKNQSFTIAKISSHKIQKKCWFAKLNSNKNLLPHGTLHHWLCVGSLGRNYELVISVRTGQKNFAFFCRFLNAIAWSLVRFLSV